MTNAMREALLRVVISRAAFDGWNDRSLREAAAAIEVSSVIARALFPGGICEVLELYSRMTDLEMERQLELNVAQKSQLRDRVSDAIKVRLKILSKEREAIRSAILMLASPKNLGLSIRLIYRTVDSIWHLVGDNSTDWSFYSKRVVLASVYTSALFYWLQDDSSEYEDTWAFIDRRIIDIMALQKVRQNKFNPFKRSKLRKATRI